MRALSAHRCFGASHSRGRTHPGSWRAVAAGARVCWGALGCAGPRRVEALEAVAAPLARCKLRCLAPRWSQLVKSKPEPKHDSTRLNWTGWCLLPAVLFLCRFPVRHPASPNARPPARLPTRRTRPPRTPHSSTPPSTNDIIRFCDASLSLAAQLHSVPTTRDAISHPDPTRDQTRASASTPASATTHPPHGAHSIRSRLNHDAINLDRPH